MKQIKLSIQLCDHCCIDNKAISKFENHLFSVFKTIEELHKYWSIWALLSDLIADSEKCLDDFDDVMLHFYNKFNDAYNDAATNAFENYNSLENVGYFRFNFWFSDK